ncbi:MAG: glycoside hydrolase family 3 protein, partial [Acidobacteriaceae bacterium]
MKGSNRKYLFHFCSCLLAALLLTCLGAAVQPAIAQGPQPITPPMVQKIDAMINKLTLKQKINLLGGGEGMATQSEPSIGLPALRMSDGPVGVRSWGPSTAYAAGIGLAASWDTALAKKVGVGLGEDARARGVNFLLGPAVDIYRLPLNGRNFEYFGEDPYLASQIAVGYIDGLQSQGVSATIKHFAANNSEYDRSEVNSVVDERTLREIYLPTFEAAVKQAHVGAVMDSYNLVNGEHSTQNKFLNIQVLRKDWGFRGIVMSDWGGAHDAIAVANGGLDLEMPSGKYMNAATLIPAIQDGKVSIATIDEKVRHILQTAMSFGFFDGDQTNLSIPRFNQQGNQITLEAAEEGPVLLKNAGHLLPLNRRAVHSIAVLGPDAYPPQPSGGGSANIDGFAPVSFMTGLSDSLYPGIKIYWNAGIKTPEDIFSGTSWCTNRSCKTKGIVRTEYLQATGAKLASVTDAEVSSFDASGDDISSG